MLTSGCAACGGDGKESTAFTNDDEDSPRPLMDPDFDVLRPLGKPRRFVVDYAVAGVGTAGAPLVKFLSDDPNVSVFAVEGGPDARDDVAVNDATGTGQVPFALEWFYIADVGVVAAQGSEASGNGPLYLEGRMWGGSSGHNFLLTVRGTPGLYNGWATASGNDRWLYDNLLPSMIYLEKYIPTATGFFDADQRGADGPLCVWQGGDANQNGTVSTTDAFITALTANGAGYSRDYNDPNEGVYVTGDVEQYICPTGDPAAPTSTARSYAASAFLTPLVVADDASGNGVGVGARDLFIASNATVIRVLFDDDFTADELAALEGEFGVAAAVTSCKRCRGSRQCSACTSRDACCRPASRCKYDPALTARGLRFVDGDQTFDVIARRKTILCAGTMEDPVILMRSGIGPAATLERLGVAPRLVNENVGANVQNHYGPIVIMAYPDAAEPAFAADSFFPDDQSGADGPRGVQMLWAVNAPGGGEGTAFVIVADVDPEPIMTVEPVQTGFPQDITIHMHLFENATDRARIAAALKKAADISISLTNTLPLVPPPEVFPAAEYAAYGGLAPDDDTMVDWVADNGDYIYFNHNSGATRMSDSAETGVVDGDLAVFGICNLAIADNSVAPRINDGNTAYTAYVIGQALAKALGAPVPF